jgi:hypothetical protein
MEYTNREQVEAKLSGCGIARGSKLWEDYTKAKRVIFGNDWYDGDYGQVLEWITDYLKL